MATKKPSTTSGSIATRASASLERMLRSLRREAEALISHNRKELKSSLLAVRKDLQQRADRALRDVERRVLKQFHAANEDRVRRLEQRVAKLEKALAEQARRPTTSAA